VNVFVVANFKNPHYIDLHLFNHPLGGSWSLGLLLFFKNSLMHDKRNLRKKNRGWSHTIQRQGEEGKFSEVTPLEDKWKKMSHTSQNKIYLFINSNFSP
jgi:hypothetical protein